MKTRTVIQSRLQSTYAFCKKLFQLTIAGGAAFWVTSLGTSLLPIAAKYRAAFSNWSIQAVWIGSLIAGIMIGCCVSYLLLRFYLKIPGKGSILKSVVLSSIALVMAIILNDVPMILQAPGNAFSYFLIGVGFNVARFLFLGIAVGYRYQRLYS